MKTTKALDRSGHRSTRTSSGTSNGSGPYKGISGTGSLKDTSRAKGIPGTKTLRGISDKALLCGIGRLSERERKTVLSILLHLIEIERRRLYLSRGYSSLFEFCTGQLGYCESTASRRIRAARCVRDFPAVYRLLASGRVALSNVVRISGVINAKNSEELLSEIEGRSAREVDLIVSRRRPKSAIRDKVSPVYIRTEILVPIDDAGSEETVESRGGKKSTANVDRGKSPNSCGSDKNAGDAAGTDSTGSGNGSSGEPATERRMVLEQRFRVEFGVDQGFLEKLERVRSLLSTKHHRRLEFAELFEILLDEHIERHSPEARACRRAERERRQAGHKIQKKQTPGQNESSAKTSRAASAGPKKNQQQKRERSRHIPRSVRDKVYARDKGRCTFISPGGRRCGSTWDLQIDHIVPFARGGDNTAGNLRLLCGKHNRLEAKRAFGEKHMERFVKELPGRYRGRSGPVIRDANSSAIREVM